MVYFFVFYWLTYIIIKSKSFPVYFYVILLVISIITIYPVSKGILYSYEKPGTWYRITFLINSLHLSFAYYFFSQTPFFKRKIIVFIIAIMLLVPVLFGTEKSKRNWHIYKKTYEICGKFYLNNPNKLLYDNLSATWFMGGIKSLFKRKNDNIISERDFLRKPISKKTIAKLKKYKKIVWVWNSKESKIVPNRYIIKNP